LTPLAFEPKYLHGASRRARSLTVVRRVRDEVAMSEAQEVRTVIVKRIATAHKASNEGRSAHVGAAPEQIASRIAASVVGSER
jgi:hypothetical protein